mmetsp:Transcript_33382/g.61236  ORF Transcript_33382/g.61236 Transcript_33382/m.61236 type:complete len:327 (-) Transcript_33382:77-1057(-)
MAISFWLLGYLACATLGCLAARPKDAYAIEAGLDVKPQEEEVKRDGDLAKTHRVGNAAMSMLQTSTGKVAGNLEMCKQFAALLMDKFYWHEDNSLHPATWELDAQYIQLLANVEDSEVRGPSFTLLHHYLQQLIQATTDIQKKFKQLKLYIDTTFTSMEVNHETAALAKSIIADNFLPYALGMGGRYDAKGAVTWPLSAIGTMAQELTNDAYTETKYKELFASYWEANTWPVPKGAKIPASVDPKQIMDEILKHVHNIYFNVLIHLLEYCTPDTDPYKAGEWNVDQAITFNFPFGVGPGQYLIDLMSGLGLVYQQPTSVEASPWAR